MFLVFPYVFPYVLKGILKKKSFPCLSPPKNTLPPPNRALIPALLDQSGLKLLHLVTLHRGGDFLQHLDAHGVQFPVGRVRWSGRSEVGVVGRRGDSFLQGATLPQRLQAIFTTWKMLTFRWLDIYPRFPVISGELFFGPKKKMGKFVGVISPRVS